MREWPLIGRSSELRAVGALLTDEGSRGVVVSGATGVGKTRLAHECLQLAEDAGMETIQIVATRSAAQLPFGAVALLLPTNGSLSKQGPDGTDGRVDLLRRAVSALAERTDDRRLVLFVDDAHLLDDASATLVHHAVVTGAAVVLATVRTGEPAPDPIVALWKDHLLPRIELEALDENAALDLLGEVLQGPVDPAAAVQFMDRCWGNALFLRELVMGAIDDGNLYDDQGIWRLRRELAPSPRLIEIVEARLGSLDDDERSLMEVVAYGEPLGLAELSALSTPELADSLERRGLLSSDMDGRRLVIRLAHPLYGDVVRSRTPGLRARSVAGALADAVEATTTGRQDDLLRVAEWRLLAGGGNPEVLLRGAEIAKSRWDNALAERLARAAVDAGAGFDARLMAAHMASRQGRRADARSELLRLAAGATDDDQRGRVALVRFENAVAFRGLDELKVLDESEAGITDPAWRDRLAALRLSVLLSASGPRAAYEAARPLLDHAEGEALVVACTVGGRALARMGRLDEALDVVARALILQREDPTMRPDTWWNRILWCGALNYAGRFKESEEILADQQAWALRETAAEARTVFATMAGSAVGEVGRPRAALRSAREALGPNEQAGRTLLVRQNHIHAALALALAGRADEAADGLSYFDRRESRTLMVDETDVRQARAWTAVAAGDLARARGLLEQSAQLGEEIGDLVGASNALHALARLGRAAEVRDRLAELASRIDGHLATARAVHAEALAGGSAESLEKVSRDFEDMGADLLAAEAAADAAVARRRAGETREAAAAELRVGNLVDRAENPVTPALQATGARARLTPAERETATLAGRGRSNKQIADQLYLSPRTVENRLQRVYEKLGIGGRTELADALSLEAEATPSATERPSGSAAGQA